MRKNLEEIVQRMNDQMKQTNRNLAFSIDDVANRYVISVKHSSTGEIIRQIPDESILRVAHSIEKRIARIESESTGVRKKDRVLNVKFPDPPQSGVTVVTATGLSKGYGGPPVFEDVSFDLGRGERLLVLGLSCPMGVQ